MKGNRKLNMWLAPGLAVLALVLAGCPHNNLLDGGGGAGGGGGSRGGNGEVQLIITNFVDGSAGRAASWQGGPVRTIAPEHIDLKDGATIGNYVFVVTGTGGGTYGPEFIEVAQNTGIAALNISGGAVWEITVDAYDIALLKVADPTLADKPTIIAGDVQKVIDQKDTALVLTGNATVDIGSGSQATLTLTNDGVGDEGKMNVNIYFDTPTDSDKIRDDSLDVTVALYDLVTGEMVLNTDNIIITGGVAPASPDVYNTSNVKKGNYQFRLTVTDPADGYRVLGYHTDTIIIEGNRVGTDDVRITNLFNVPSNPTALKVYWHKRDEGELKDGFKAEFKWAGISYNAVGIDMEIADITTWYSYSGSQHKVNFGDGEVVIANNDDLWNKIDTLAGGATVEKDAVVTTLSWEDSPQNATKYPAIWKEGSLLNGSNEITLLMQTGHVYSVRIKAAGAQTDSGWYILGDTNAAPGTGTVGIEFTALTQFQGLFDLVEVTYDLEDKYFLYKTGQGNAIGTKATKDELVEYHEYNPTGAYMVDKKYTDINHPSENDWFLYPQRTTAGVAPTTVADRSMTWTGWQNKNDSTDSYLVTNNWNAAGYTGYTNLHLISVGAGTSVTVQAETSGTFDVLDDTNVLVSIEEDEMKTATDATWQELGNGDTNPRPGLGGVDPKNTGLALGKDNTRYILNLNQGGGTPTVLYVTVGDNIIPDRIGTLVDKNANEFTVSDISVSLTQGLTERVIFNVKPDGPVAYYKMDGVTSGDYVLKVKILANSAYWQTYQVPFVVKYDNQVIN